MANNKSIEVFQDLTIRGPSGKLDELRKALIASTSAPWTRSEAREKQLRGGDPSPVDFLVFEREETGTTEAVSLHLWRKADTYAVTNIVPIRVPELGRANYNKILQEFAALVAEPAADNTGFEVILSASQESLEDWLSQDSAAALKTFSAAANKSTGSSHPYDKERWMRFLILAHRNGETIHSDKLARWFTEVEDWGEDKAVDLVIEYEFARELLSHYDQELP